QQIRRALTHLPEWRASVATTPRKQQRAGGVLPKMGGEQGRAAQLTDDQVFDPIGVWKQQLVDRPVFETFGQAQSNPVVGPDRVQVDTEALAHSSADRQSPGSMHPASEGREHTDAPVPQLVAEPLDHDRAIAWNSARALFLLRQVSQQVAGRQLV